MHKINVCIAIIMYCTMLMAQQDILLTYLLFIWNVNEIAACYARLYLAASQTSHKYI